MKACSTPSNAISRLGRQAILTIVSALSAMDVAAQKQAEFDYLIRFTAQVTEAQEKYIHEALQGHEPGLGIWVDRPYSQVKVRTHLELDRASLESAWVPAGLMIASFGLIGSTVEMERSMEPVGDPFPVFIDTGHPAADHANHEAAKAIWFSAHPPQQGNTIPINEH